MYRCPLADDCMCPALTVIGAEGGGHQGGELRCHRVLPALPLGPALAPALCAIVRWPLLLLLLLLLLLSLQLLHWLLAHGLDGEDAVRGVTRQGGLEVREVVQVLVWRGGWGHKGRAPCAAALGRASRGLEVIGQGKLRGSVLHGKKTIAVPLFTR